MENIHRTLWKQRTAFDVGDFFLKKSATFRCVEFNPRGVFRKSEQTVQTVQTEPLTPWLSPSFT